MPLLAQPGVIRSFKMQNVIPIEKDHIANLVFPIGEVLENHNAIHDRKRNLISGMLACSNFEQNALIVFEDEEGMKQVKATIFATTEKNIVLKGGFKIPLSRVHSITTY